MCRLTCLGTAEQNLVKSHVSLLVDFLCGKSTRCWFPKIYRHTVRVISILLYSIHSSSDIYIVVIYWPIFLIILKNTCVSDDLNKVKN